MQSILIIEDDTTIMASYSTVLEQEGYAIHQATNGTEGFQVLANNHIDLILLDMMLPGGMNGFDVIMKLKQDAQMKEIPVVVLTNLESEKQTALDYGALDYIIKAHTDVKQLVEKIKILLPQSSS